MPLRIIRFCVMRICHAVERKALTFDDVLLLPATRRPSRDTSFHPSHAQHRLNLPLVSAAMDTVTEAGLAITLAQKADRHHPQEPQPQKQAAEVAKVKRFEAGVLRDPITVTPDMRVREAIELQRSHRISGCRWSRASGGRIVTTATCGSRTGSTRRSPRS